MAIGLDVGSSSVKAIRLDRSGRVAAAARRVIATRRGAGGRVEHDAAAIVRAAFEVVAAAARGGAEGERLGIATQRSTVLFWDPATGRPLTPAYSWQDRRAHAVCARLAGAAARLEARTGLRLSPHYSASKIAWALRHVRGLARRVASGRALWGTLGTFLVWRLSGGALYGVDHANAQRTLLLDLDALSWDPALADLFGLGPLFDAPHLPALLPTVPGEPLPLAGAPRGLRLAAWTGDQQAALIGTGCRRPGDVAINYGSGAFVLRHVGAAPVRAPGLLTSLLASWRRPAEGAGARTAAVEAIYALEGTVNAAATAIDWAERAAGRRVPIGALDRLLAEAPGGRPRLHFLPAVSGLGAPRWDPGARPFFAGDTRRATAAEMMRAVIEAIACRCAEILRAGDAAGVPAGARGRGPAVGGAGGRPGASPRRTGVRPVYAAGGLTRCRALLQAQADLLQRPVVVRDLPDATGLGVALMAAGGPAAITAPPGRGARGRGARRRGAAGRAVVVRPRLDRFEAEARYRAWENAVYGRGGAG
jgi:glycerol kinase